MTYWWHDITYLNTCPRVFWGNNRLVWSSTDMLSLTSCKAYRLRLDVLLRVRENRRSIEQVQRALAAQQNFRSTKSSRVFSFSFTTTTVIDSLKLTEFPKVDFVKNWPKNGPIFSKDLYARCCSSLASGEWWDDEGIDSRSSWAAFPNLGSFMANHFFQLILLCCTASLLC